MKKRKAVKLLYKSFDKDLTTEEQNYLQKALKADGLETERREVQNLRHALEKSAVSGFSPFFSEKVVSRVKQQGREIEKQYFFESLTSRFYRVAVAAAVAILILISFSIIQNQNSLTPTTAVSSSRSLEEMLVPAFTTSLEDFYED
ncbi:hypothetical protein GF407_19515 [candidate division KSB1 bacterium]|nr:hypothetical protein [candidate division KSB1 bacterium]